MSAQAKGLLEAAEIAAAERCLQKALSEGASMVRVTIEKGVSSIVSTLDGRLDKVTGCLDRSIQLNLSADGRRGAFSTNRLDPEGLDAFAAKAVRTVRMLAPDPLWALPLQERVEKNAATGLELGLYDPAWETLTPEKRREIALFGNCAPFVI